MSMSLIAPFLIGLAVLLVLIFGLIGLFKAFYRKVEQGTALIVNDMSTTPKVHFTGALIIPVLYKAEEMQISLINLEIDRRGKEGLICKDNMRADIRVNFYLRVNEKAEDVLKVAKTVGAGNCAGCQTPLCIGLHVLRLSRPYPEPLVQLSTETVPGGSTVSWQGGAVDSYIPPPPLGHNDPWPYRTVTCSLPVPARNHTWGSIKSLYH